MTTDTKAPGGASLVINRAKWLRGDVDSCLLHPRTRRMCCLGFYGLSIGLNETEIASRGTPEETLSNPWPSWLLDDTDRRRTRACQMLMSANDSGTLSDADREREIASIFAEHGVTVTFIDDEASGTATEGSP